MIPDMPAKTLVDLYRGLEDRAVKIWIDGGWGVDALLGEQTRPHDDVDIVVQEKDLAALVALLIEQGYRDVPRDDTRPWNFVLGGGRGCEVDIHVIRIAENGDGIYGPAENGEAYPAYALTGTGTIDGQQVRCMTLGYQIVSHRGYELRDKDVHDIRNLCERFDLALPEEYRGRSDTDL